MCVGVGYYNFKSVPLSYLNVIPRDLDNKVIIIPGQTDLSHYSRIGTRDVFRCTHNSVSGSAANEETRNQKEG